jgi:hypothetical protein
VSPLVDLFPSSVGASIPSGAIAHTAWGQGLGASPLAPLGGVVSVGGGLGGISVGGGLDAGLWAAGVGATPGDFSGASNLPAPPPEANEDEEVKLAHKAVKGSKRIVHKVEKPSTKKIKQSKSSSRW